jgi:hypothetical protein
VSFSNLAFYIIWAGSEKKHQTNKLKLGTPKFLQPIYNWIFFKNVIFQVSLEGKRIEKERERVGEMVDTK